MTGTQPKRAWAEFLDLHAEMVEDADAELLEARIRVVRANVLARGCGAPGFAGVEFQQPVVPALQLLRDPGAQVPRAFDELRELLLVELRAQRREFPGQFV